MGNAFFETNNPEHGPGMEASKARHLDAGTYTWNCFYRRNNLQAMELLKGTCNHYQITK
jgi:hypothetical protein